MHVIQKIRFDAHKLEKKPDSIAPLAVQSDR